MNRILFLLVILPFLQEIQTTSVPHRIVLQICIENNEVIFVGATLNRQFSNVFSCDESLLNFSLAERLSGRALWLEDLGLERLRPGFLRTRDAAVGDLFLGRNKFKNITPELLKGIKMYQLHLDWSEIEVIRAGSFVNEYLSALRLNDNIIRVIEPGAFTGLTKLTWISLLRNKITDISFANTFQSNLTFLSIEFNLIAHVPTDSFTRLEKLEYLGLEANVIEELGSGAFNGLKSLVTLSLHYNRIKSLKYGVFGGLGNLTRLYLNNNEITTIEPESFKGLDKLGELDLSHNPLVTIESRFFKYLSGLTVLKYNMNNLTMIDENTFGDLKKLRKLEVMGSGIKAIKIGAFKYTNKLEALILIGNELTTLEIGAFRGLENITEINLSANQLVELKPGVFDGLPTLRDLKLDYNNLTYLKNGTFSNLKQLHALTITNNQISDMDLGVFTHYPRDELQLNNNKFTKLVPGWFNIVNLTHLAIDGNNITEITREDLVGLPGLDYLWFNGLQRNPTKV